MCRITAAIGDKRWRQEIAAAHKCLDGDRAGSVPATAPIDAADKSVTATADVVTARATE